MGETQDQPSLCVGSAEAWGEGGAAQPEGEQFARVEEAQKLAADIRELVETGHSAEDVCDRVERYACHLRGAFEVGQAGRALPRETLARRYLRPS